MTISPLRLKSTGAPLLAVVLAAGLVTVAAPAPAQAAGAVVIKKGGSCSLFNGSGAVVGTGQGRAVVTPSGNGVWKCRAKVAAAPSGRAVTFTGAKTGTSCVSPAGTTKKWRQTISASGRTTLICHVR
jgi:hypothetical protein